MSGNVVTLEFAGDEKKLTSAMDRVGSASKAMGTKVGESSTKMTEASSRFDRAGESADGAEGKFMGFHDVLDGVKGGLETLADPSATFTDKLIGMGQAGADVAGGMASFLLPMMGKVADFMKGPLLNALKAVASSPLLLALTLLVTAFVVLWTTSETFRAKVLAVLAAVGNFIKGVFLDAIHGITTAWDKVVGWFTGLPGKIGKALGGLGGIISGVFKGALNTLIDGLNWGIDRINSLIHGINWASDFVGIPAIPDIPHVARLHTGGVVPGMPGSEQLMILQAGETVTPKGQGGGGAAVTFKGNTNSAVANLIMSLIRTGEIQIAGAA